MKRSTKKGFTIVELVIVIAIIAILAAVLIPTFASLIQKANESKDTQLVKNLNTALAADNKEHKTMSSALEAAEEFGFDVEKIVTAIPENEILWDSLNDVFCYYDASEKGVKYIPEYDPETKPADYQLWRIYSEMPATQTYSIYWSGKTAPAANTELKVGFDAGKCAEDMTLTYVGNGSGKQIVTLLTNGGTLTINAETDTVNHYGWTKVLTVEAVDTKDCYHEFGFVLEVKSLGTGKFIAESGSKFHQTKGELEELFKEKTVDLANAEFECHYFGEDGVCVKKDAFDPEKHTHDWSEWTVTTKATDTECGEKTHTCTVCNYEGKEQIPALGHDLIHHEAKAPTCTEKGWDAYDTCSRCDHTTYKELPALGHNTVSHEAKAATCTEAGNEAYVTCSRCDYTTYKEIAATGHKYDKYEDNNDGATHKVKCSVCGDVKAEKENHTYTEGFCACGAKEPSKEELLVDSMNTAIDGYTGESIMKALVYMSGKGTPVTVDQLVHTDATKTFAYDTTAHKFYIVNTADGAVVYPAETTAAGELVYVVNITDANTVKSNMTKIYINCAPNGKIEASYFTKTKNSFTSIEVGGSVTCVGSNCFYKASKIESVYVGNNVVELEKAPFASMSKLKYVYYNAGADDVSKVYYSVNGAALFEGSSDSVELTFGKDVKIIPCLFGTDPNDGKVVSSITFEEGIAYTVIRTYAFRGMPIDEFYLPASCQTIEIYAFENTGLKVLHWDGHNITVQDNQYSKDYNINHGNPANLAYFFVYKGVQSGARREFSLVVGDYTYKATKISGYENGVKIDPEILKVEVIKDGVIETEYEITNDSEWKMAEKTN